MKSRPLAALQLSDVDLSGSNVNVGFLLVLFILLGVEEQLETFQHNLLDLQ